MSRPKRRPVLDFLKQNWPRMLLMFSALTINAFAIFKVRLMYLAAFPGEVFLSVFFMLGIVIGEIGGVAVVSRVEVFDAAYAVTEDNKHRFNLRLGWFAVILLNVFEMFNIVLSSNIMLNGVNLRDSFTMVFSNWGELSSTELSGVIISIVVGVILPIIALIYWKVSAGIRSAEQILDYLGLRDGKGNLKNPNYKHDNKDVEDVEEELRKKIEKEVEEDLKRKGWKSEEVEGSQPFLGAGDTGKGSIEGSN